MPFWIPAMLAGTSLLGSLFGNKSKKQQQKQYTEQQSQQQSSYNTHTNMFGSGAQRIDYDPLLYALRNNLIGTGQDLLTRSRMQDPRQFAEAVAQQNVAGIVKKGVLRDKLMENELARRGLGSSTAGAYAQRVSQGDLVSDLVQNSSTVPILERQAMLENEQLENARRALGMQIFSSIPKDTSYETWQGGDTWGGSDTTTKSSGYSEGETTIPGNMLGGAFTSLGSILAFLYGQNMLGGNRNGMPGYLNWGNLFPF